SFLNILSRRGIKAPLTIGLPASEQSALPMLLTGPRRGFHFPHTRDATGLGAPYIPEPTRCSYSRPATIGCRAPPLPRAQVLPPRSTTHLPELQVTRRQSGSPSVLPRQGPLRTVRATSIAHGSSKPQGRVGNFCSRVALKILRRSLVTFCSWARQSI